MFNTYLLEGDRSTDRKNTQDSTKAAMEVNKIKQGLEKAINQQNPDAVDRWLKTAISQYPFWCGVDVGRALVGTGFNPISIPIGMLNGAIDAGIFGLVTMLIQGKDPNASEKIAKYKKELAKSKSKILELKKKAEKDDSKQAIKICDNYLAEIEKLEEKCDKASKKAVKESYTTDLISPIVLL